MGCFSRTDNDVSEPKLATKGKRSCTDLPCLLLLIVWWGAVIGLVVTSIQAGGDIEHLSYRTDYKGDMCGGPNEPNRPIGMWIHPMRYPQLFMCVESCDEVGGITDLMSTLGNYGCSKVDDALDNASNSVTNGNAPELCQLGSSLFGDEIGGDALSLDVLESSGILSSDFKELLNGKMWTEFGKVCVPDPSLLHLIPGFGTGMAEIGRGVQDVEDSSILLVAGAVIVVFLSFLYAWFLRVFARALVWMNVLLTSVGTLLLGLVLLSKAQQIEATDKDFANLCRAFGALALLISVIFTLAVCCLRNRIRIAIEVVREASRVILSMKYLVFFPLLPIFVGCIYVAAWIWGYLTWFSVQELTTSMIGNPTDQFLIALVFGMQNREEFPFLLGQFQQRGYTEEMASGSLVLVFHLFWSVQFFIYFTYSVVAGAVAEWYFTPRDENGKKITEEMSTFPILKSLWRVVRYNLGTIAFGAFLIAVCKMIQKPIAYIQKKCTSDKPNFLQRAVLCMMSCFFKCLEWILNKVNQNALLWNAIYGSNFCTSAVRASMLKLRNKARCATLFGVSGLVLFIGKIGVSAVCTGIITAIMVFASPFEHDIGSPILPAILVFLISYTFVTLFIGVYDAAIDTIFLCFLIDEDINGASGNMLCSDKLAKIVNKYAPRVDDESSDVEMAKMANDADVWISDSDDDDFVKDARQACRV